jgi:hypothetical protein
MTALRIRIVPKVNAGAIRRRDETRRAFVRWLIARLWEYGYLF